MPRNSWCPSFYEDTKAININCFADVTKKYRLDDDENIMRFNRPVRTTAPAYIRTEKCYLKPTPAQAEILQHWFHLSRCMYNATIDYLEPLLFHGNELVNNYLQILSFNKVRTALRDTKNALAQHNGKNIIPIHSLDQAIAKCIAMYKSSISNHERREAIRKFREKKALEKYYRKQQEKGGKNIKPPKPRPQTSKKPFQMKHIMKTEKNQFMTIEGTAFSKKENAFAYKLLGVMQSSPEAFNTNKTCTLIYKKHKKEYILLIPRAEPSRQYIRRKATCGIDPGIRSFLTVYSEYECFEIGSEIDFKPYYREIDDAFTRFKDKKLKKKAYKSILRKINLKIQNKVKDMHFKVAKFLCQNYQTIKIGKLNVKSLLRKNKKTGDELSKYDKRKLLSLSHYKFREILHYQGMKYGCVVQDVNEYLTTKTCSSCCDINEVGRSKVFACFNESCNLLMDRDINAAKNIRFKEPIGGTKTR